MNGSGDYLSVKDLAELLGINKSTAYDLVNADSFPAVRVGKRYVIPRSELDRWMNEAARERKQVETGRWR